MGKIEAKGTCQYCGKELSKAGVANHEKACSENPANKVTEKVVEATPTLEPQKQEKQIEELVTIKIKTDLNCYIGDRYYRFIAGEVREVPQTVKERLMGAGLLEAI